MKVTEAARPDDRVREFLASARGWTRRAGRDDLRTRLDTAAARVDAPACHVVVVGEFKKGKSSLLNALLNARVCPTDADIATAVPNYLTYGSEFSVRGMTDAGEGALLTAISADAAARGQGDPQVRALEIRLPRELLATGVILVDTPGVGGGLASNHAAIALRALARADVVLFVADAGSEYSAPELELLSAATRICPNLLCVLTKVDLYPEWQRIVDADRAHLDRVGVTAPILTVSSTLRQAGLTESDDELISESGFPLLTSELLTAVDATGGSAQASAAAVVLSVLGQIRSELSARRKRLGAGPDLVAEAARRATAATAKQRAIELRGVGSGWQQVLNERLDDLHGEIELDLTVRLRRLRREAADQIANTHPKRLGSDLGPWLQQQTNLVLLAHVRRLQDEIEAVADAVADQFGSASWELRSGMELDSIRTTSENNAEFGRGSALQKRLTKFEVGLATLRGGATGAVVSHAAGILVGIAIPVVIPVAIALSAVLGGKSWQTARSGQLRVLRAEAERAVAIFLEEVDTVARKDSRDALRRTRRQLREMFAERALDLLTTAMRTADALERSSPTDDTARLKELAVVDAELAELADLSTRARAFVDELVPR